MSGIVCFVAINTLVFLGLSVSRFLPWPPPVHPRMLQGDADAAREATRRQRLLHGLAFLLAPPAAATEREK